MQALLDVYTYTAVISMCIYQQDVERALGLAREMRVRGIERNVHTYTALMNVCIKCGRCPLALETYHHMRADGCAPNVVTFNTLIDVHGKMGQWEQAIKVLNLMKNEVKQPCRPVLLKMHQMTMHLNLDVQPPCRCNGETHKIACGNTRRHSGAIQCQEAERFLFSSEHDQAAARL